MEMPAPSGTQQMVEEGLSVREWSTEMETKSSLSLYRVLKRGRRFMFENYLDWSSSNNGFKSELGCVV